MGVKTMTFETARWGRYRRERVGIFDVGIFGSGCPFHTVAFQLIEEG